MRGRSRPTCSPRSEALKGASRRAERTRHARPWVRAVARDLHAHAGGEPRPRGRRAAARGARSRACHERDARQRGQHRDVRAAARLRGGRASHGLESLVRAIDAAQVADAGRRRAATPRTRPPRTSTSRGASPPCPRRAYVGIARTRPRALARWSLRGGALARSVERRPRVRRDAVHRAAARFGPLVDGRTAAQVLAALARAARRVVARSRAERTGKRTRAGDFDALLAAVARARRRADGKHARRSTSAWTGRPSRVIVATPPRPGGAARDRLLRRREGARRSLRRQRVAAGAARPGHQAHVGQRRARRRRRPRSASTSTTSAS